MHVIVSPIYYVASLGWVGVNQSVTYGEGVNGKRYVTFFIDHFE
jgi:hypothetical protein